MKWAFGALALAAAVLAGTFGYFFIEERRLDRDWILANRNPRPALR